MVHYIRFKKKMHLINLGLHLGLNKVYDKVDWYFLKYAHEFFGLLKVV